MQLKRHEKMKKFSAKLIAIAGLAATSTAWGQVAFEQVPQLSPEKRQSKAFDKVNRTGLEEDLGSGSEIVLAPDWSPSMLSASDAGVLLKSLIHPIRSSIERSH